MLPLPAAITSQLDKASIIRLTISYLKLRDFSAHGDPSWNRDNVTNKILKSSSTSRIPIVDLFEQHQGTHILQSLDGFALAVAGDGRFLYISETVSIYLGLSQVEMTGSSIFDYVHQGDHAEIAEQLGLGLANIQASGLASPSSGATEENGSHGTNNPDVSSQMCLSSSSMYKGFDRSFCIRMKSTLTKRGCHFKSSGYRVILMLCRLRPQFSYSHTKKLHPPLLGMVALAIALPPPSVHEIRLECDMFVTRINFDFKIAHCESRVQELLDYTPEELTGKNLYNLCHGQDVFKLRKCHFDLINKGQVLTHYYRIMNKHGGYTWLQTCATVVCSSKNTDEQNIICVNYVISCREDGHLVLDCCQMQTALENIKCEEVKNRSDTESPDADASSRRNLNITRVVSEPQSPNPQVTEKKTEPKTVNEIKKNSLSNLELKQFEKKLSINSSRKEDLMTSEPKLIHKRKFKNDDVSLNIKITKSSVTKFLQSPDQSKILTEEHLESSVKNIENAISKHLQTLEHSATKSLNFCSDSLMKQQEQNSTIQWIGTQHSNHSPHQQLSSLPASKLLKQLYTNRESVIRATARQTSLGTQYSANQRGLLPTPPGSESSFDNQFVLQNHQKSSDSCTNLFPSYNGLHTSIHYHTAITPPGSVSPKDSENILDTKSSENHSINTFSYSNSLRNQFNSSTNTTPNLPLKPHPYTPIATTVHHAANSLETFNSLEQCQYFSHHSSFHLYHKGVSSAGWYTAPS